MNVWNEREADNARERRDFEEDEVKSHLGLSSAQPFNCQITFQYAIRVFDSVVFAINKYEKYISRLMSQFKDLCKFKDFSRQAV